MKHEKRSLSDEWLTPPFYIKELGPFDTDPCVPEEMPWKTAGIMYTPIDNGLMQIWKGKTWLNPPYGKNIEAWMNRMAMHNNGIALVFARTETEWFSNYVWKCADGILFIKHRVRFYDKFGKEQNPSSAPSVLISYGEENTDILANCSIQGQFLAMTSSVYLIYVENDPIHDTWKVIVHKALIRLGGESGLERLYETVMRIAPEKLKWNNHPKEKIRQTLQKYFKNVEKGKWRTD